MPIRIDQVAAHQLSQKGITEKQGSYGDHTIKVAGASDIKLNAIKAHSIPFQGFRQATKVRRGKEGLDASASRMLTTLRAAGGLNIGALLRDMKTITEFEARNVALGTLSVEQKGDFLRIFAPAVETLSNAQLASVYQNLNSAEMTLLEVALDRESELHPDATDANTSREMLFDLQALVLKEMSNRVSISQLEDAIQNAKTDAEREELEDLKRPKSLSEQYTGVAITRTEHTNDISASNLHVLANVSAQSANQRERIAPEVNAKMASREMNATAHEMGDILRSSPLTINMATRRLLSETAFYTNENRNAPLPNLFHTVKNSNHDFRGQGYVQYRTETENHVFPEFIGHDINADERPVYGAVNMQRAPTGAAETYGSTVIILKPEVGRRATFIAEDTFYSPIVKITPEKRQAFYHLLGTTKLSSSVIAELQDETSLRRGELDAWFDKLSKYDNLTTRGFEILPRNTWSSFFSSEDRSYFGSLLLQVFGDPEATRSRMATYDNLESLLPGLGDLNGALLASAAERQAQKGDGSVSLGGMNYIEAQIQGPLIPSRDFAEVRVDVYNIPEEAREQVMTELKEFQKSTGVKVTFYSASELESVPKGFKIEYLDTSAEDARIQDIDNAGTRYYAEHIEAEARAALQDLKAHLPERMRVLARSRDMERYFPVNGDLLPTQGALYQTLKSRLDSALTTVLEGVSMSSTSVEKIVTSAFNTTFEDVLNSKVNQLKHLESLNLRNEEKERYTSWILTSMDTTVRDLQAYIERDRIQNQLDGTLQSTLRQVMTDLRVADLFAPEGDVLPADGGLFQQIKASMIGQIQTMSREHLSTYPGDKELSDAMRNGTYQPLSVDETIRTAANKILSTLMTRKRAPLEHLRMLELNEAQRVDFAVWVLSSKVRTVAEVDLAYQNACAQETAFRAIAFAKQPLSTEDLFILFGKAAAAMDQNMLAYRKAFSEDDEYGADDKMTDISRGVSLSLSLLAHDNPPFTNDQLLGLKKRLYAPDFVAQWGQLNALTYEIDSSLSSISGFGEISFLRDLIMLTRNLVDKRLDLKASGGIPSFNLDYTLIPQNTRNLVSSLLKDRGIVPQNAENGSTLATELDRLHPLKAAFPAPVHPENLPQTKAQRRQFLVNHLETYLQHEKTFDKRAYHGRGHITRAYIFASTLCSILEKAGVPIDRTAVLCAVTGHDSGRKGSGVDAWEHESAANTVAFMKEDYGDDTLGADFENSLQEIITNDKNPTLERLVFQSADSLDIGRLGQIDPSRVSFSNVCSKEFMESLIKEVEALQALTYPLSTYRQAVHSCDLEISQYDDMGDVVNRTKAENKRNAIIQEMNQKMEAYLNLTNEEFVTKFENVIRDNPGTFPLLTEHFINEE